MRVWNRALAAKGCSIWVHDRVRRATNAPPPGLLPKPGGGRGARDPRPLMAGILVRGRRAGVALGAAGALANRGSRAIRAGALAVGGNPERRQGLPVKLTVRLQLLPGLEVLQRLLGPRPQDAIGAARLEALLVEGLLDLTDLI